MLPISKLAFPFFLFLLLLFEGLGIRYGREVSYYLIIIVPFFLFLLNDKKVEIPKKIAFFFVLFLVFSAISTIFSVNIQKSFEYLLFYLAVFLIFVYVLNNKEQIEKLAIQLIFAISFLFSLYSVFVNFLIQKESFFLVPVSRYQFVYPSSPSHNHLGDFLVLSLVILFYYLLSNRTKPRPKLSIIYYLLSIIYFLPYFIFSYSRSSYLSFFVMSLIILGRVLHKTKRLTFPKSSFFLISASFISFILFFITVKEIRGIAPLYAGQKFLSARFELTDKQFLATRTAYFKQAFSSIINKPLVGVGPDNFSYLPTKYTKNLSQLTFTSHNLFLDIISENGILSGIFFLAIIGTIIFGSGKNIFFLLAVAMLINFQTDYTFKIYSFFLLFFVLAGLVYKGKDTVKSGFIRPLSLIIFLIGILIILSNIAFKQGDYKLAFYLYPLNTNAYLPIIENEVRTKNFEKVAGYLSFYSRLFSGDEGVLKYVGYTYERMGNEKKALSYYEKAHLVNLIGDPTLVEKIYEMKSKKEGRDSADKFINDFFERFSMFSDKWAIPQDFRIETMKLCQRLYSLHCPYDL